jgi:hypothetical protein
MQRPETSLYAHSYAQASLTLAGRCCLIRQSDERRRQGAAAMVATGTGPADVFAESLPSQAACAG